MQFNPWVPQLEGGDLPRCFEGERIACAKSGNALGPIDRPAESHVESHHCIRINHLYFGLDRWWFARIEGY